MSLSGLALLDAVRSGDNLTLEAVKATLDLVLS